ncbi:MAG TPA: aldo/keto reductase, partial [Dehalococcoidia bacterium]|nr:aldo/keto reductase [Dehalococcoidia bacterium]
MRYRRMGRTGLRVSEICLGTMTFGFQTEQAEAFRIMDAARDGGGNFIDTADVYPIGSDDVGTTEEIVGAWLRTQARDSVVLATKCRGAMGPGPNDSGLSRGHILDAVDASLKRLGTDYIDLYQMHFSDTKTPIDETLRALDDVVRSGKVRYIGVSNYRAYELAKALGVSAQLGLTRFDCDQPRYNILYREIESEVLPLCREEGVGIIAYNPLAGGFLTGKYDGVDDLQEGTRFTLGSAGPRYRARYWDQAQFEGVSRLKKYFTEREVSLTHAAVAWVLAQDGVTSAIVGASRAEQVEDSLKYQHIELNEDDFAFCDEAWYALPRQK